MKSRAFFFNRPWAIDFAMRFAATLALVLLAAPAAAGETAWQELAPGVRARLVSNDVVRAGKTLIGLELDMPANTKTYWRIPGETGIAAELDFAGSTGIGAHTVLWPYPTIDEVQGYLDYVYFGPTVFPIEVAVEGDAATVSLNATLGVCSDICVPAVTTFSLPLDFAKADMGQGVRLSQAMAEVPIDWEKTGDAFGTIAVDGVAGGLTVALEDSSVDPASIIADTGDPAIVFGAPQKSPDGHSVFLPLLGGDVAELWGQEVRITFMTAQGPYEVWRHVEATSTRAPN